MGYWEEMRLRLMELEEELDELKFRRDNGFLPQEDYAELAAEITERLNELQE